MKEIVLDKTCLHKITCGEKMIGFTIEIAEEGKYSGSNFNYLVESLEEAENINVRESCFGFLPDKPIIPFKGDKNDIVYEEDELIKARKTIVYKEKRVGHVDTLKNGNYAHPFRFHEFDTLEEAGEDYVNLCNGFPVLFSADNAVKK